MRIRGAIAAFVSFLAVGVASAEWRVDVSGGAFGAASTVTLPERNLGELCCGAAGDVLEADFGAGGAYALGVGYRLTDHVEAVARVQHALSRNIAEAEVLTPDLRLTDVPTTDSRLDVFSLTAGGRFHLLPPGRRLRPWLVTEIGWYHADAEVAELFCGRTSCGPPLVRDDGSGDGFGLNVGGGLDVALTDALFVGLDVRYHHAFVVGDLGFVTTMGTLGVHF